MVLGRYLIAGYLDPWGCQLEFVLAVASLKRAAGLDQH